MTKFRSVLFSIVMSGVVTACGGGGGSGDSGATEGGEPARDNNAGKEPVEVRQGGDPAAPVPLYFGGPNEISADTFKNHFKYTASKGDTLYISVILDETLSDRWFARCSANPNAYYIGINIKDVAQSCSKHLVHTFEEAGTYMINLGYPDGNSGTFRAAVLAQGEEPIALPANGSGGAPDTPRGMDFEGENSLGLDSFDNYYAFDAQAGQTIYIQSYIHPGPSLRDESRCVAGSGRQDSYYSYGIQLNDGRFSCSEYFEHTFEEGGVHVLGFRFIHGATGYFHVTVSDTPL